jgi:three-Cys-motif partner protein
MADDLPTVWDADPHTLAKHRILKHYLDAWAPILSHAKTVDSAELLFVDGFAGPGTYATGEPGSPVVAINAIVDHMHNMPRPVRFMMIENRRDRFERLCSIVGDLKPQISASKKLIVDDPLLGDCDAEIQKLIGARKSTGKPLGPALFFLDQFGYANVPMTLVRAIMQHDKCEVLSYLNCKRMNAYLADEAKWPTINAAYGNDSWRAAIEMSGPARQHHLIESYKACLQTYAGVEWPRSFAMFGNDNELLYWLVFSTKSLKGLEQMKRAMWKADDTGSFRFSDRDASSTQGLLFFEDMKSDEYQTEELFKALAGRTMSEPAMYKFVLKETPFYKFKKAVQKLVKEGRATKVSSQPWRVRFSN